MDQHQTRLTPDQARSGVTGHGVRYVLGYGLLLAVVSLFLLMLFVR